MFLSNQFLPLRSNSSILRKLHFRTSPVILKTAVHFETKYTTDTRETDLAISKDVYIVKIPLISRAGGHGENNSEKVAA